MVMNIKKLQELQDHLNGLHTSIRVIANFTLTLCLNRLHQELEIAPLGDHLNKVSKMSRLEKLKKAYAKKTFIGLFFLKLMSHPHQRGTGMYTILTR